MREAIGGTWLFSIVIFFIVIFAGFMCFYINYNKAFKVKDDIITIIERNNGFKRPLEGIDADDTTMSEIVSAMKAMAYSTTAEGSQQNDCNEDGWFGFNVDGKKDGNYAFCIREISGENRSASSIDSVYYEIKLFYKVDVPVISSVLKFDTTGYTKLIYNKKS